MFESIEAIRGCLIGPKPWDRINIKKFETKWSSPWLLHTGCGCEIVCFAVNHVLIGFEAGSGREMWVHNVNR